MNCHRCGSAFTAVIARARETGGAGVGVALVKELVTAMGSTVSAESTLGRGSKFSITLRQADVSGQTSMSALRDTEQR